MTGSPALFQGVCEDHQASVLRALQPVHPERGGAEGRQQHQQHGGGSAARAGHRGRRTQPSQQAAGGLSPTCPPPSRAPPRLHLASFHPPPLQKQVNPFTSRIYFKMVYVIVS